MMSEEEIRALRKAIIGRIETLKEDETLKWTMRHEDRIAEIYHKEEEVMMLDMILGQVYTYAKTGK